VNVLEEYTDYRAFMRDYYDEQKKNTSYFSYRYFCKKAALSAPSLFPEVMHGKRNLTERTIAAFCRGFGFEGLKAEFFKALVLYTQSEDEVLRQNYLEQMRGLKCQIVPRYITPDLYDYYSQWYHVVIRELACTIDWKGDYQVLANAVVPAISAKQAKDAVRLLLSLGLLEKRSTGFVQRDSDISSGEEVTSMAVRRYNAQMMEWAKKSLDSFSPNVRHASNMVVGLSRESYLQIKREINYFHQRVTQICHDDSVSDQVYSINIQMFPVAKLQEKIFCREEEEDG
jgi:uncharacterized protein (TIGR02147 family)